LQGWTRDERLVSERSLDVCIVSFDLRAFRTEIVCFSLYPSDLIVDCCFERLMKGIERRLERFGWMTDL